VPRRNPIGKIKDAATEAAVTMVGTVSETMKDPVGTGQKVVGTAVGQAVAVAGRVGTRLPRRKRPAAPAPKAEARPVAEPQAGPRKDQGDPVAPAKKATAKKTTKKTATKKTATKKTAAKKATAKKTATKKTAAKKTAAKKTAAKKTVKKTAAKKAPVKKAPSAKAAVTAPTRATRTAPATKAPPRKAAKKAADLAAVEDSSVETPVGTTGADPATNPDTTDRDLQQPGTAPLMDPSLTNQVKSEAETSARASDVQKG
jgi:hypothetical protein